MIATLGSVLRRLRRGLSPSGWMIRLLGLSTSEGTATAPALVMVQIDGLSHAQLASALERGEMPFLRRLIGHEHYRLHRLYSGLPSSTPAVQAEIFYGVKTAVPAFCFRDSRSGELVRMYQPSTAARVERELALRGEPLLRNGSAYVDVFTGGAAESHFCPASLGWGEVLRSASPVVTALLFVTNGYSFIRTLVLSLVEVVLSLVDCVRGLIDGQDLVKELKFVPTRVMISIGLRELVTIGARIDIARGLPIIHLNLIGYDEQAHRRGPDSKFAHWTLKGIDDAVRRIWHAAERSARRHYDVWIYSDHGQAHTIPYTSRHGRTIDQAVTAIFARPQNGRRVPARGEQSQRARLVGGNRIQRLLPIYDETIPEQSPMVAALGPVALVYCAAPPAPGERARLARELATTAAVPLVLSAEPSGAVRAWIDDGEVSLADDRARLFGADHPFLDEVVDDLTALCRHADAGDFVLCGWRHGMEPITFAMENGAHAGPCPAETEAFALLPDDAIPSVPAKPYLRPLDLRRCALHHLGRDLELPWRIEGRANRPDTLRVMTYNVHSCIGMDGKLSPGRVARVIARHRPDIVALQELDVGRRRTGGVDQAHQIARLLQMEFHFHPAIHLQEERYGDAILTHLPMRLVRTGRLPRPAARPWLEPRGALWAAVDTGGGLELQVVNTHLGLSQGERWEQVETLLGNEWLGHPDCRPPVILCGDLNARPGSRVCRRIVAHLDDAQRKIEGHRAGATFASRYPTVRIDHIFVSAEIEVVSVEVLRTSMTRVASDHLPVLVEIRIDRD